MRAKKPFFLLMLILALLAAALIAPAAASGKNGNQPVNWVVGNYEAWNYDEDNVPQSHIGFTMNVRQLGPDLTLEGVVLQKTMYTDRDDPLNPFADAPVVRRATEFSPERGPSEWPDYWWFVWQYVFGLQPPYLANYACFYDIGADPSEYAWPDLTPPCNPDEYFDANIADFDIYLPASFLAEYYGDLGILPPELWWDTYPHRYVVVDFDDPTKEDLVQIYGWNLSDAWIPLLGQPDDPLAEPNYELVPVPAGNFQVPRGRN